MSFSDHPPVAEQLQRSLERGRLAHAYLFVGARGAGKEAVARTLAKALNCEKAVHDCCDDCDACRRIQAGNHPDIYWVRPESKSRRITVEQIRAFEKAVNFKASMARIKVGIVVDADCMGDEASNAFLKTLEEPPAQTIIILLTAQPQRLLTTILSRCLKISFGAVARAESPYRARLVPVLSGFSSRSVAGVYQLHAAVTGLLQKVREEIREQVETEQNLDRYSELDPKVRERLETQCEARIEGEYRAAREQVLEELYSWFGDVWLCVEQAETGLLEHPEHLAVLQAAAADLAPARAAGNLDAIEQIREALTRNINETLALEVGLLKLLRPA
ncbi:MAG: DNA polymerase III subunit delta' [Verrucomicrobiota bacterium]